MTNLHINNYASLDYSKTAVYFVISLIVTGLVLSLFYYSPVLYAMLIAEDHWAEYGTFVCFGLSGLLLLLLSFRKVPSLRRGLWVLFGLAALIIAAEEISWGQRIVGMEVPAFIKERNLQGEITLHNMHAVKSLNQRIHGAVASMIVLWIFFSLTLQFRRPGLWHKMTEIGVPLIPLRLAPLFLLQPFFFFFNLTAKNDELGEFFLGFAALFWTIDLALGSDDTQPRSKQCATGIIVSTLLLVAVCSTVLTHFFSEPPVWRLNKMAERDYPGFKMYAQAEQIYQFIYQHTEYLTPYTRINHGELLLTLGKSEEAREMLKHAANDLATADISNEARDKYQAALNRLLEL